MRIPDSFFCAMQKKEPISIGFASFQHALRSRNVQPPVLPGLERVRTVVFHTLTGGEGSTVKEGGQTGPVKWPFLGPFGQNYGDF